MKYFHFVKLALALALAPASSIAAGIPSPRPVTRSAWADWAPVTQDASALGSNNSLSILSSYAVRTSVDNSRGAWKGLHWHYSGIDPDSGEVEEFTVFIIDHDDDKTPSLPLLRRSPQNVTDLILPRDNWICKWVVGCYRATAYAASISRAQIEAVAQALRDRLLEDNNRRMLQFVGGQAVNFSVGLLSGIAGWYITNRLQGEPDKSSVTDVCVTRDEWNARISQLQDDIRNLGAAIQASDSRPRTFNHYSEETQQGRDGHYALHAVKPTKNPDDYQPTLCT